MCENQLKERFECLDCPKLSDCLNQENPITLKEILDTRINF